MYGMVNKAVEDMVCMHHGEEAWEQIKSKAGVDVEVFVSNEGYPDEVKTLLPRPMQARFHKLAQGEVFVIS